jgi:hypothetical protein
VVFNFQPKLALYSSVHQGTLLKKSVAKYTSSLATQVLLVLQTGGEFQRTNVPITQAAYHMFQNIGCIHK